MTTHVITLMWGTAWERYGEKFVSTFDEYWPGETRLRICTDRDLPTRHRQIPLESVPGYRSFLKRWDGNPKGEGRESRDRKSVPGKRFWKHDAVKWAPQCLSWVPLVKGMKDDDIVIWLDADVETTAKVPPDWGSTLLGRKEVACLLRHDQHPEIGFWAARLNDKTRAMIDLSAWLYISDAVFRLPEWHSAFVFGEALARTGPTVANINPTFSRGHCWPKTALAQYTIHKKGKLKDQ